MKQNEKDLLLQIPNKLDDTVSLYVDGVFVDKLDQNLEKFNQTYLVIKELFENEDIPDFSHLPDIDLQIPTVVPPPFNTLKYDGVTIYQVPTSKFKIKWWDKEKRNNVRL